MDLDDVEELFAYWRRNPPPAELLAMVAQFIGWKPPEKERSGDLAELLAMFPGGTIK
jgi:hypothetical protein